MWQDVDAAVLRWRSWSAAQLRAAIGRPFEVKQVCWVDALVMMADAVQRHRPPRRITSEQAGPGPCNRPTLGRRHSPAALSDDEGNRRGHGGGQRAHPAADARRLRACRPARQPQQHQRAAQQLRMWRLRDATKPCASDLPTAALEPSKNIGLPVVKFHRHPASHHVHMTTPQDPTSGLAPPRICVVFGQRLKSLRQQIVATLTRVLAWGSQRRNFASSTGFVKCSHTASWAYTCTHHVHRS